MPLLTMAAHCEEMHESNALLEESVRTLMLEMDMLHEERLSTLQEAGCFFGVAKVWDVPKELVGREVGREDLKQIGWRNVLQIGYG